MQDTAQKGSKFYFIISSAGFGSVSLLACALFVFFGVTIAITSGFKPDPRGVLVTVLICGVVLTALAAAVSFLGARRKLAVQNRHAKQEISQLKKRLYTAESVLCSEPQILVSWEETGAPHLKLHTLSADHGIPRDTNGVLRFRNWLEPKSASDLEAGLNALFQDGKAFNFMLKTVSGSHVEVVGMTTGGRLLLRIRDLVGQKKELSEICEQHRLLGQKIAAKQALLDAVPIPVWFRDGEGKSEWVNKAYVSAVEAKDKDETLEGQIEFLESRQKKKVEDVLAGGQTFRERLHTIVGGERRAYDTFVLPLGAADAGMAIDVAALESAKGELDQHIAAHTRTLDRVSTAIAMFGPDQTLTFYNQAYLDLWELDAQWLESSPRDGEILDRLRETRRLPEQADYRAWRERQLGSYQSADVREDWWHLPDGRSLSVVAEQRPDGGVTYLYDDATERLALESRYNELFRVQRETLENLQEGVAVFATDGRLTLFNAAFASIWRLNLNDLDNGPHIDQIIEYCRVLHEDRLIWNNVKRAVTAFHEQRKPIEGQLERADGSVIAYACQPLPDGATLLNFVDITDTKRVERVLTERNDALEAADRMKNDFIQNVSYELRTPLTNIVGFADLLATSHVGELNKKQREYLGDIRVSSGILLSIIDNILDLATIDAGGLELKRRLVKVEEVMKAAALGVRDRLVRARIGLDIRVDRDVSTFFADEKRAIQIVYNLLANAIGFSPEGSRIRLSCKRDDEDICFTVEDQGCGIGEDLKETVFDRFESRSQGSRHRGAGLGLSIVKSLIELHDGSVKLESAQGEGTRVIVRFPEKASAGDAVPSPQALSNMGQQMRKQLKPPPPPPARKATSA